MRIRYGRNVFCQKCGKDDRLKPQWEGRFRYAIWCLRCNVPVKEQDTRCGRCGEYFRKHGHKVSYFADEETAWICPDGTRVPLSEIQVVKEAV